MLVGVVVLALFVADWYATNREVASLLDTVSDSKIAIQTFDDATNTAAAGRQSKDLGDASDAERAALRDELSTAAVVARRDINRDLSALEGASILPWHHKVAAARKMNAAYMQQWRAMLATVSGDGLTLIEGNLDYPYYVDRDHAYRQVESATPVFPLWGNLNRAEELQRVGS